MKKIVVISVKESKRTQTAVKAIVEYGEANYGKPVVFQESLVNEEFFQATIAGITLENPNPVTIRFDFTTKQVQIE